MGFFDRLLRKKSHSSVNSGSGWTPLFGGGFHANFQNDVKYSNEDLAAHPAVFSCISLIAQDIGKMGVLLKQQKGNIKATVPIPKDFVVLKKPNHYQTWQQFLEFWMICRKLRGNVYVFKVRDVFGRVVRLVLLNPDLVKPLVSDDGQVLYQLSADRLNGTENIIVPASEIIHDRENCLFHPLVGLPAITAYGLSSGLGLNILKNSKNLFGNMSRPSGLISAPGPISPEKAKQAGDTWNENYSGQNVGKTAVLGDGLTYQSISMTAEDSQTIEQLKMSNEIICSVLHVPAFKVGYGTIPAGQKVGDLNEIYFSDCLQSPVEAIENLLDEAFDLKSNNLEVFLDVDALIRMDKETQMNIQERGVKSAIFTPNEARQAFNLEPITGGDTVYMQQQNYSLEALAKRDQKEDPFGKPEVPKAEPKSQYQGVFKSENSYEKGCFVTHKGSLWHCEKDHAGEFNHENFKLAQKKWGDE
jgi:HK97 family phage portal protein